MSSNPVRDRINALTEEYSKQSLLDKKHALEEELALRKEQDTEVYELLHQCADFILKSGYKVPFAERAIILAVNHKLQK
jgi:hypothetical protein